MSVKLTLITICSDFNYYNRLDLYLLQLGYESYKNITSIGESTIIKFGLQLFSYHSLFLYLQYATLALNNIGEFAYNLPVKKSKIAVIYAHHVIIYIFFL